MNTLRDRLRLYARKKGWPYYECDQCVGQEWWQGCYCDHHGCVGPCKEPNLWHRFWRWVEGFLRRKRQFP